MDDKGVGGAAFLLVLALLEQLQDDGVADLARIEAIVARAAAEGAGPTHDAAETALLALSAFIGRQS